MPIPFTNKAIINYNQNITIVPFDYINNDTDNLDDNDYVCTITNSFIEWVYRNSTSIYN